MALWREFVGWIDYKKRLTFVANHFIFIVIVKIVPRCSEWKPVHFLVVEKDHGLLMINFEIFAPRR